MVASIKRSEWSSMIKGADSEGHPAVPRIVAETLSVNGAEDVYGVVSRGELDLNTYDTSSTLDLLSATGFTGVSFSVDVLSSTNVVWLYMSASNTAFDTIGTAGLRFRWNVANLAGREILVAFYGSPLPDQISFAPDADPSGASEIALTYTTAQV